MLVNTHARERVWTRRQIEGLIAAGHKIIILDGQVIKADAWLPYHPGGDKAILHMVGRDGTEEVRALHSLEAQQRMKSYIIGRVQGRWTNFAPPIQGGHFRPLQIPKEVIHQEGLDAVDSSNSSSTISTAPSTPIFDFDDSTLLQRWQTDNTSLSSTASLSDHESEAKKKETANEKRTLDDIAADLARYPSLAPSTQDAIVAKYRELNSKLYAAGLYDCPYSAYVCECARYSFLFSLFVVCLHYSQYALSGFFLGLFWHQLAFSAHDAGHMGITHNFHIDTCIGILVADFLGGLSMGWWKRSHNVHHIVTNSPEHDPDNQHMPIFAVSHRFFTSLRSSYHDRVMTFDRFARIALPWQSYLYYPILAFGRFNLYVQSWIYLLSPTQAPRKGPAWWHRYLEIAGHIFFWIWFGYFTVYRSIPTKLGRLTFILISHMVTAPLHVQITLSHFAMSTADLGVHESFPQKMLRTTMDVDCPPWLDFIHGGLQFQAVHHLFPRIPRHNLRKAQEMVIPFCEDVGIPYVRYGFVEGNRQVVGRLGDVAKQVAVFEECRRVAAGQSLHGHHGHHD